MEPATYVTGTFPILSSAIYMIIKERVFNPLEYLKKVKARFLLRKYEELKFDIDSLNLLTDEEKKLLEEIASLKIDITAKK